MFLMCIYSLVTEMRLVAGRRSKNIWHNCTIFREIEQVDVPLSTKNFGFQKKKKKGPQKKGRKLI